MAHDDYVKRSRPSNSKKKPYKKKQSAAQPQGIPVKAKLIGLLTIMLIAGAGYFLWSIKDNQPQTVTPKSSQVTATKKHAALPPPPKEKWTYVDDLKTKEVEVGEYEVKNGGPYQMQCGSFRKKSQAESVKATIAFAGIESQVRQTKGKSGIWYKVVLGPYERKRQAEKDKHKLKRNNINACQIWGWR